MTRKWTERGLFSVFSGSSSLATVAVFAAAELYKHKENVDYSQVTVLYLPLYNIYLSLPEAFALLLDLKKPFF